MWKKLVVAFLVALPTTALAGGVYKCKNAEGVLIYQEKPCATETQSISSWQSQGGEVESENDELTLPQGNGGHYHVEGSVNGQFVNFIVDTGASALTIPLSIANAAGMKCQKFGTMNTANGASTACAATVKTLTFGGFTLHDVDAIVAPNLNQPLLGMNVLKRFHIDQNDGKMRLKKNY